VHITRANSSLYTVYWRGTILAVVCFICSLICDVFQQQKHTLSKKNDELETIWKEAVID
jgi:hypothetical protein